MIEIIPIKTKKIIECNDNLEHSIYSSINDCNESLFNNDVIVISSKVMALCQGRQIHLNNISASYQAKKLGLTYNRGL